jgi:outer membrane protein assembly factor BamB
MATPWATGDVVYFVSKAGEVICVARETGKVYWIRDLNEGKRQTRQTKFLGREVRDRAYWTGVVMANNRLITVSSDGRAVSIDPITGAVQGYLKLGKSPVLVQPIAAGGMIYVVTDKAELIAIG